MFILYFLSVLSVLLQCKTCAFDRTPIVFQLLFSSHVKLCQQNVFSPPNTVHTPDTKIQKGSHKFCFFLENRATQRTHAYANTHMKVCDLLAHSQ